MKSILMAGLAACCIMSLLAQGSAAPIGTVTVQVTAQPANMFIPSRALGAGVDGLEQGEVAKVYTRANVKAMNSVGLRPLTYRLRTELGVEAWHWNPDGAWSEGVNGRGYWTSNSAAKGTIAACYGYKLPRRGSTIDQANNDGYSRLDDGDPRTFWKSNPYLDRHFTGEDNARHPQWVLVNFGRPEAVDAIVIRWAAPFATRYQVQYWQGENGGSDAQSLSDTFGEGAWRTFPGGAVRAGQGGEARLRLSARPVQARFVRIVMTQSSGTATAGSKDARDRLGYAIREIGLGTIDGAGRFHDRIRHAANGKRQTPMYASSTDPWHRAVDRDPGIEQPGFDRVFRSGLTHGLPLLTPTGLLYDTPENAAAELRFLRCRGYAVSRVELGEEPDGQYVAPEDYGALYLQWTAALRRVDPAIQMGGPSFQTDVNGWRAWPDANGNGSWMNRFVRYLKAHGRLADFQFFSFEWYPFDNVCASPGVQLAQEPSMLTNSLTRLLREGLPRHIPWIISEYGYSSFAGQVEMEMPGALLNAEVVAQFLTLGGQSAYLYGYEPNTPIKEVSECNTWGNLAVFLADDDRHIRNRLPTYYAARLLVTEWAQEGSDQPHAVYRAASEVKNARGQALVTAYAVHRPDGQWAVLLLNKDPKQAHTLRVQFKDGKRVVVLTGPVAVFQYSPAQYRWHPNGENGYPSRDLPPAQFVRDGKGPLRLPPYSLTVVRGRL